LAAALAALFAVAGLSAPSGADAMELSDPPVLAASVSAGDLPPVRERFPYPPAVASWDAKGQSLGEHGGTLTILMGRQKDIRMMMVYGYARLVGYNPDLELVTDIVERIEVADQKSFTFHLRQNHKWSDGHPFTAEDFRYYYEDIVNDKDISPFGLPKALLVDGEAPRFEVVDERTVRYSWSNPNPYFLPAIAGARPLFIYRPAHFLKQFHEQYAEPDALAVEVDDARVKSWAALHNKRDNMYKFDNHLLPTLQPWINATSGKKIRHRFERWPQPMDATL
jgi:peptide/nickel transport system substrate-binding protein